jgi:predicted nucleic-acid-binding Zn-ribbon protein
MGSQDVWACGNCQEVIERQFDACWRCGCSRDGTLNLNFVPDASARVDPSVDDQIAEAFVCRHCANRGARTDRISARAAGLRMARHDFLAVSCDTCGLTEFFSLNVLEGRSDLGNFFRGLFGS